MTTRKLQKLKKPTFLIVAVLGWYAVVEMNRKLRKIILARGGIGNGIAIRLEETCG